MRPLPTATLPVDHGVVDVVAPVVGVAVGEVPGVQAHEGVVRPEQRPAVLLRVIVPVKV